MSQFTKLSQKKSHQYLLVLLIICSFNFTNAVILRRSQRLKLVRFAKSEELSLVSGVTETNPSSFQTENQPSLHFSTSASIISGNNSHPWTACPPLMRSHCTCSKTVYGSNGYGGNSNRKFNLVNCTNAGQNNSELLRHLPEDTEVLIFTGNELQSLPKALFNPTNRYDQLHTVDLSNNGIELLKAKSFHNARNLKRLILNHNRLQIASANFQAKMFSNFEHLEELQLRDAFALPETVVSTNTSTTASIDLMISLSNTISHKLDSSQSEPSQLVQFGEQLARLFAEAQLTHLKVLNIEANRIADFGPTFSLCQLPSLQKLYLAQNHLHDLQLNFSCIPKLRLIDLSENRIHRLSNRTLQLLDQSRPIFHINLARNPFFCDCGLLDLVQWLLHTRVWVLGHKLYTCASGYPASNANQLLNQLDPQRLQCDPNSALLYGSKTPRSTFFRYAQQLMFVSLIALGMAFLVLLFYGGRPKISLAMQRARSLFGQTPSAKHTLYSPLQKCQHVQTAGIPIGHTVDQMPSVSISPLPTAAAVLTAGVPIAQPSTSGLVQYQRHPSNTTYLHQHTHKTRHPNKINSVQQFNHHKASI